MKRILLCTDGSSFCQISYHYAAWLAAHLEASNNRIRHLVIGSTTAQILRGSHIPVLLFR